jgi:hypothetical protein
MEAYAVTVLSLLGLCVALVAWLVWTGRREFRPYRVWQGGRWGCVQEQTHWGAEPMRWWLPESEIQGGCKVVEWEEWPTRTRVRKRKGER